MIKRKQPHKPIPMLSNNTLNISAFNRATVRSTSECCSQGFGDKMGLEGIAKGAFTRVDLLAAIVAAMLVLVVVGFNFLGERGRIAQCTRNLQVLGGAMQSFANDHGGALPPANFGQPAISWDMELVSYVQPGSAAATTTISPGALRQLESSVPLGKSRFCCPSDPARQNQPRSYAMSAHDMKPENWPPGPNNKTGVGLVFDNDNAPAILGKEAVEKSQNVDAFALVKLSWITDPANTLLLTELPGADSQLGQGDHSVVTAQDQMNIPQKLSHFHCGRFNYLMADGHVELLTPFQTGSWDGTSGIWSIRKEN